MNHEVLAAVLPRALEGIFEPFVQLARGQTIGVVGTGLGLSISRDLARAMGAELTVVSEIDRDAPLRSPCPAKNEID